MGDGGKAPPSEASEANGGEKAADGGGQNRLPVPADGAELPESPGASDGVGLPENPGASDGGLVTTPAGLEHEARELFVGSLITTVRGLEFVEAQMHALRLKAVAALHAEMRRVAAGALEAGEAASITAAEIAAALNVSQRAGRVLVEEALVLTNPGLTPVLDAMEEGRIDRRRARSVMEYACVLPPGKDAEFCSAAVDIACPEDADRAPSPAALSRRLRRLAEDYHDEPLAARKERATAFRKVEIEPSKDGMCWITAHLPVEVGAAIDTHLEALARSLQGPGESRGISQLRADVFRDLLIDPGQFLADVACSADGRLRDAGGVGSGAKGEARGGVEGRAIGGARGGVEGRAIGGARGGVIGGAKGGLKGGVRTEVIVTVPARSLSGESETPGEILGYGPIDAPAARLLAAEAATWMTMYVDPESGAPLALGRKRYTPSLAIRRFLGARDRTCRFPGCDKPAPATEADHTEEWHNGGETDVANLALLCREHHWLKSSGFWKLRQVPGLKQVDSASAPPGGSSQSPTPGELPTPTELPTLTEGPPGGVLEWTSPTGRRYVTHPERDLPPPF
ncbi:hypothetical protein LK10_13435 [Sinomonas humi]|uniref:HNH nuclease domain-containing protein n=2 Tax=Sinomonas humi TaxID=1338436 RepID=A0A0B2AK52_9MICC|nr:hypothetical protein LK10_13435 [Sinomonas humi]